MSMLGSVGMLDVALTPPCSHPSNHVLEPLCIPRLGCGALAATPSHPDSHQGSLKQGELTPMLAAPLSSLFHLQLFPWKNERIVGQNNMINQAAFLFQ